MHANAAPAYGKLRSSCDFCTESKLKCSQEKPACRRCIKRGRQDCTYSHARRPGRLPKLSLSNSSIAGIVNEDKRFPRRERQQGRGPRCATDTISADTHTLTARQSADCVTSTTNTPHTDQRASRDGDATAADPTSLTPVDLSAGTVMTSAGNGLEQVLGGTFHSGLFDSISSRDWSQLGADNATGEGPTIVPQSYSLGAYASDRSTGHLGWSPVSTFPTPMSEDSFRPHAWPFDSSGIQGEGYFTHGGRLEILGESSSASSSGRCPSIETAVASLLYTSLCRDGRRIGHGPQCECPRLLNQLVQFTNQSSMLSKPTDLALDLLFAMEQVAFSTKEAISKCMDCDLSSPYVAIIICATIDWILENLSDHLRDGSFLDEGRAVPSTDAGGGGRLGSSHPDQSLASDASTLNSHHLLSIGQLSLTEEASRACIVELLKLRLRRLVRTVQDVVSISRKNKKTLSDVVRGVAKDVCRKAEAMFGMIDL